MGRKKSGKKNKQVTSATYAIVHCFLVQRISNIGAVISNQIGLAGSPILVKRHGFPGGGQQVFLCSVSG